MFRSEGDSQQLQLADNLSEKERGSNGIVRPPFHVESACSFGGMVYTFVLLHLGASRNNSFQTAFIRRSSHTFPRAKARSQGSTRGAVELHHAQCLRRPRCWSPSVVSPRDLGGTSHCQPLGRLPQRRSLGLFEARLRSECHTARRGAQAGQRSHPTRGRCRMASRSRPF